MELTALLEIAAPNRDRTNEEAFTGDGREQWLALRDQVHRGIPQTRLDRRVTRRWIKFSKKGRKKIGRLQIDLGIGEGPRFEVEEIRAWILHGTWPPWIHELRKGGIEPKT